MARTGSLDFVILGGDLVDYVYKLPRRHKGIGRQGSNFELFEAMVTGRNDNAPLEVPVFTQTGNHDYRLYPYQFSSYGLRHCGLHDLQTRFLLNMKGRPRIGVPMLRDLESISARVGRRHSLTRYFWRINPAADYAVDVAGVRFVFLDTGRDAFLAWRQLKGRWSHLWRTLRGGVEDPDSEGLWDCQVEYLGQEISAVRDRAVVLLVHAPLFNPVGEGGRDDLSPGQSDSGRKERKILDLDCLRSKVTRAISLALERRLIDEKLREGCIFQNHAKVVKLAWEHGGTWLALSGHIHRNVEVRLDRATGQLYQGDYTSRKNGLTVDAKSAYFLAPTALGHVQSRHEAPGTPSYFEIKVERGRVERVQRRELHCARSAPRLAFFVREHRRDGGKLLRVTFDDLSEEGRWRDTAEGLSVIFWVLVARRGWRKKSSPVEVLPVDEAGVSAEGESLVSSDEGARLFGDEFRVFRHQFRLGERRDVVFSVGWLGARRLAGEVVVTGEARLATAQGGGESDIYWHPRSFSVGG